MPDYRRLPRFRVGRRGAVRDEIDDEIDTHLELRTDELVRTGMSRGDAEAEARRRFGDSRAARRALYASARRREGRLRWRGLAEEVGRDVRLALRRMRRSPGYTTVAVSLFALGIALTTSMFSVVDHVLLRPLPFPAPDRLVSLQSVRENGTSFDLASMANWYDWQAGATTLASSAVYRVDRVGVDAGDQPRRATAATVSGAFFETLRPTVVSGRTFTEQETREGAQLAVVSSAFAERVFGTTDLGAGRDIEVTGRPRRVVGVIASGSLLPEDADVWQPMPPEPGSGGIRNNINYQAIGRLTPGATLESARTELGGIARGIREQDPEAIYSWGVGVLPLAEVLTAQAEAYLLLLLAASGGVLLIACANLAGLGLARGRRRRGEVALCLSLGAGRGRITRQLLTEQLVLAAVGGALGLAIAIVGTRPLIDRVGTAIPRAGEITLDLRVAAFAFSLSLLAGVVAGWVPALRAARSPARAEMVRTARGGGGSLPGGALVAGEIALAFVLLVGGGLLLRSFLTVVDRDLGYEPEGVVTAEIVLPPSDYPEAEMAAAYWAELLPRLRALPGVEAAGVGNWIPTGGSGTGFIDFPDRPESGYGAGYRAVSAGYFEAMGMSLVDGRVFDATDVPGGERVAVVNESLAATAWPGQSAVGQLIRPISMESYYYRDREQPFLRVVGVVADVRHYGLEWDPEPEVFVVYDQVPFWAYSMTAVVRAAADAGAIAQRVDDEARALDPSLAVEVALLDDRVRALLAERRLILLLLGSFATAALFLVCLGVYGLVSFAAAERTRELAIRTALGARRSGLLRLMLERAAAVVVIGAGVGVAIAYLLQGVVRSLVVDVSTADPLTYVAVALLLTVVALTAALVPSLRAVRSDPVEALVGE
jgi:putative ABC transport system permease protein